MRCGGGGGGGDDAALIKPQSSLIKSRSRSVARSVKRSTDTLIPHKNQLAFQAGRGASINDIHKIFGFFGPLSPRPHLELIDTIKFMQPPLLCTLFHDPLPHRCGHNI